MLFSSSKSKAAFGTFLQAYQARVSPGFGEADFALPFFMEISMSAKLARYLEFPDISTAQLPDSEIKTRKLGSFCKKALLPARSNLAVCPSGAARASAKRSLLWPQFPRPSGILLMKITTSEYLIRVTIEARICR